MPLGPGLGFTELESVAYPAFQASLLQATRLLNSLDQDRFPIPQHDKSPSTQYKRAVDGALSKMHILDSDPSLKLQHTLTQQLSEQRFKALYDRLDLHSRRIVDSAMKKHAGAWLKANPHTVPELSVSQ